MIRQAVVLLAVATLARGQAVGPPHPDSSGAVVGIVTMKEGGLPLPYSVVSAPSLARERFSSDQGVFLLTALPVGRLQLRVRHLGYSPVDLSVDVHAGRTDTVHVQLVHIAVRLATVEVHDYPPCVAPGPPKAAADSAFAAVFDQLRQNADQYRLLTRTYPYVYAVERTMSTAMLSGKHRLDSVDTSSVNSSASWTYRPGSVVERRRVNLGRLFDRGEMTMNIPTLVTFADPAFIDNHCFYNGGVETVAGVELLRVDFNAAARIKDPDVNGSMYLDPSTFQIRRSMLRLSRVPPGLRGLVSTEAVTYFGEVLASIPIIVGIESVNRFTANSVLPETPTSAREEQRLIAVQFIRGKPGDEVKKP